MFNWLNRSQFIEKSKFVRTTIFFATLSIRSFQMSKYFYRQSLIEPNAIEVSEKKTPKVEARWLNKKLLEAAPFSDG